MQYSAKQSYITHTHFEVLKPIDGDGLLVRNKFTKKEAEIRLYGIDTPETKKTRKLIQDERETHVPGQLLIELGWRSFSFLKSITPPGTDCTLIQERNNPTDAYGRLLAYVILPDGSSLNELMIKRGYAKPYDKILCNELSKYRKLNFAAKKQKKGLYAYIGRF
ncbi:MAG: thermonuclease family protein [Crocinitomicaceae bacterium]|nr:thermonuclease family protein [Crocinitomicaceae bacterium]